MEGLLWHGRHSLHAVCSIQLDWVAGVVTAVFGTCVLQACKCGAASHHQMGRLGRERLLEELSSTGTATYGGHSQALHRKGS